ncbi:MAG: Obg family GTPase CgtA, partial [Oscillospiraceae bacterium]|nr:Obg family GTPase CgtA [Oscillospiraceae bacterium]
EPAPEIELDTLKEKEIKITHEDDIYFVEGKWLYRLMQSVNFDDYESLNYFQNVLINSGVIDALREAGIEEGDTVSIYEVQFEFMD